MSINEYRHKQPKHSLGTFNVLIGTWDEDLPQGFQLSLAQSSGG